MADFIIKAVELLVSARTAAKLVLGSAVALIILLLAHTKLDFLSNSTGTPSEITSVLFVLLGFGLGSLLLEAVIWSGSRVLTKWRRRQKAQHEKQEEEKRTNALQEMFQQVLPHLLPDHKKILHSLTSGIVEIGTSSSIVQTLAECQFIEPVLKLDTHKGLYKLNPAIEPTVKLYFDEQRKIYIKSRIDRASKDEREFLMLYVQPKPTESNQPEHPFLAYSVYQAALNLVNDMILVKEIDRVLESHQERLRLAQDAIEIVEEAIIGGSVQRDSITIDLNQVAASGAAGSGAQPSRRNV